MKPKGLFITQLVLCFFIFAFSGYGQTTEFNYQGSLKNTGVAANGNYDFEFALYDALAVGNQLGSTIALNNIVVTNGIFSVKLDFGSVFPGADRFLEIRVRQTGGGALVPLVPRQLLNSAPYSVKSLNSATADTVAVAGLPSGSGNYIQNQNAGTQPSSNFIISGTGKAPILDASGYYALNGSRFMSGSVIGSNVFVGFGAGEPNSGVRNSFFGNNAGNATTSGNNNSYFGVDAGKVGTGASNNAFFGSSAGQANLANGNSFFGNFAGSANVSGSGNVFLGDSAGNTNISGSGNTIIGFNAQVSAGNLTNATAIGFGAMASSSNVLVLGQFNGNGNGGAVNTRVGIGTNSPTASLEINNDNFAPDDALLITQHSNGGGGGEITLRQTRGTRAAPLATQTGDNLFFLNASGYTGSGFNSAGAVRILGEATQNWAPTSNGGRLTFWTTANNNTGGNERMRIDQNGHVGIGTGETVNPSVRLHVVDDGGKNGTIRVGSNEIWAANETRRVLFGDGSNAYVGEEDADDLLVLRGQMGIRFKGNINQMVGPAVDDTLVLGGASNRWKAVWAVDGTINTSDARLKTGVANLSYGLRHLMQLRPVNFRWKDRADGRTQLGLLAQEVEQIIPEAVVRGQDEATPLGMNYSTLLPVLIKSVQEQQTQIKEQEKKIETLEKQAVEFKRLVCSIKPDAEICIEKPR